MTMHGASRNEPSRARESPSRGRSAVGFTLIEVLVAVAVVAIMAAILIAVVPAVRGTAINAKSVGNLRQCAAAQLLRLNAEGPRFDTFTGGTSNTGKQWARVLERKGYIQSHEVAVSPWTKDVSRDGPWGWFAYGLNLYENTSPEGGGVAEVNWTSVEDRANYPIFFESLFLRHSDPPGLMHGSFRIPKRSANTSGGVWMPVENQTNVAFLDGSVAVVGPERLRRLGIKSAYGRDGNLISLGE